MQSRYIYFVNLFLIYFKWFQIYSIERTKRTSIYSIQEVVILSRKPETHFIVLVCWLCDLIYKILSSFPKTIFSTGTPLRSCDAASFPLPLASQPPSLLRQPPPLPLSYPLPHRITPKMAANESHRAQTMSFGPQVFFFMFFSLFF